MPWKGHVRFGGRSAETGRWQRRYRAAARPYQALWTRVPAFRELPPSGAPLRGWGRVATSSTVASHQTAAPQSNVKRLKS